MLTTSLKFFLRDADDPGMHHSNSSVETRNVPGITHSSSVNNNSYKAPLQSMIKAAALAVAGLLCLSNGYGADGSSWTGSAFAGIRFSAERVHDDRDPLIKYNGSWNQNAAPNRLNGTQSYSNQAANSVSFTFTGTQVSYVYARQSNMGMAQIKIDDSVVDQLDEYSPTPLGLQVATYSGLAEGTHTIVVTILDSVNAQSTGSYVVLDGFLVGKASARSKVHDDADTAVAYTGSWSRSQSSARYNATQAVSHNPGDSASFTFVGTQVSFIYGRQADFGMAQVSIDGQVVDQLDQYSAIPLGWQVATYGSLAAGTHTIQVKVSGTANAQATNRYILIDGFIGATPQEAQDATTAAATSADDGSTSGSVDTQLANLTSQVTQLQGEVATLSTSSTSANNSISSLQSTVTALSTQSNQMLQTLARLSTATTPNFSDAEIPTGTKDGVNLDFQLVNTPAANSLKVFKNGLLLQRDLDYTLTGNKISFKNASVTPTEGDTLVAFYRW